MIGESPDLYYITAVEYLLLLGYELHLHAICVVWLADGHGLAMFSSLLLYINVQRVNVILHIAYSYSLYSSQDCSSGRCLPRAEAGQARPYINSSR